MLIDILILRKKVKNSYVIEILLLCVLMVGYTYETITILTIIFTLLCIAFQSLLVMISKKRNIRKNEKTTKISEDIKELSHLSTVNSEQLKSIINKFKI